MLTSPHELIALVERFAAPRIMVLGDIMVDQYIFGNADRLSPEAPVPVVQEKYRENRAGGAGNVCADLATLGAHVLCVSVRGHDPAGELALQIFQESNVDATGVLAFPDRPTTSKIRLVGLAQHRHPQQMLRLDNEDTRPLTQPQYDQLLAHIKTHLPSCDLLCIEDYNKGLLTPAFTQAVIQFARSINKPILVDPAAITDYSKYKDATTITPNRTEAEKATGLILADGTDNAPALSAALMAQLNLTACLLTLDRHGIYLQEKAKPGLLHPTRPRTVYDVTGAGDMVLAALAMALASGASWSQAADLANIAGGLEVEKFGCVPIKKSELLADLLALTSNTRGKHLPLAELQTTLEKRRKAGQRIVFTNGVFDILHAGHCQYLAHARNEGDLLVVGVNADASVQRLKGPTRPINPLSDRLTVLAALAAVDYVIEFSEDTPLALITALQPDVLVKGADYANQEVVGRSIVEARGGRVVLAPLLEGRSTTNTIAKSKSPI